jgi:hypothetical protein
LVNKITCLKALDNYVITDEERIEDAAFGYRFRGLNEFMKIHISDYTAEPTAEQHLINLEVDIYRLKRIFERNSPSILIQSFWRGCASRLNARSYNAQRILSITKIQGWVRAHLARQRYMRELTELMRQTNEEDLLLTNDQILRRKKGKFLLHHIRAFTKLKKT